MFLTVETLPLFSVSGMCWSLCTGHFMYHSITMSIVCYCTESYIGGTPMIICTYHYSGERVH